MSDATNYEDFISNYAKMLPESDSTELQKILEMKSLRRAEQAPLIQLYRNKFETARPPTTTQPNPASSSSFSMSAMVSMATDGIGDSSMRRLEKLVKRF